MKVSRFSRNGFDAIYIKEHGEFAVNIAGGKLEKAAYGVFGSKTGRGIDKIVESRVKARKGEKTRAPILDGCDRSVGV